MSEQLEGPKRLQNHVHGLTIVILEASVNIVDRTANDHLVSMIVFLSSLPCPTQRVPELL